MVQCVDFNVLNLSQLDVFHFYTLTMSFVLPVVVIIVCFGIIAFRITELAKKTKGSRGR